MISGRQYMMPTAFGPQSGPRADMHQRRFPVPDNRRFRNFGAVIEADPALLRPWLPDRFSLSGTASLVVSLIEIHDIDWLAGRGYNMLLVSMPVTFHGDEGDLSGLFMPVLWENMADPILTGREQLGFNKIYADLPQPIEREGVTSISAAWDNHAFFEGRIARRAPASADFLRLVQPFAMPSAGIFHEKYIPRTGDWGRADIHQAVLSPASDFVSHRADIWEADVDIWRFLPATWQQMPTQWHIVTALSEACTPRIKTSWILEAHGAGDFFGQRIVCDYLASPTKDNANES